MNLTEYQIEYRKSQTAKNENECFERLKLGDFPPAFLIYSKNVFSERCILQAMIAIDNMNNPMGLHNELYSQQKIWEVYDLNWNDLKKYLNLKINHKLLFYMNIWCLSIFIKPYLRKVK